MREREREREGGREVEAFGMAEGREVEAMGKKIGGTVSGQCETSWKSTVKSRNAIERERERESCGRVRRVRFAFGDWLGPLRVVSFARTNDSPSFAKSTIGSCNGCFEIRT